MVERLVPDFFIVGAPKCGTTSLAAWLGEHPGVFMSPVKEPNHFCRDPRVRRRYGEPQVYASLFSGARPGQLCGEASTSYMMSRAAIPAILTARPAAKLIAIVRNPLDMVVSYHAQKVFSLQEQERDFGRAWQMSGARSSGDSTAVRNHAPRYLDYRSAGRLGQQVARLRALVPNRQLLVIVHDDMVADAAEVGRSVLRFLDLSSEVTSNIPHLNQRQTRRFQALTMMVKAPPGPLRWLKLAAQAAAPAQMRAMGRALRAWNSRPAARLRIADELRREMVAEFRDDVSLLGRLLDRDLRHWMET